MSKIHYLTAEGLEKLKAELAQLVSVERPSISKQIAEARDKGDLSENAEYDAAREAQGLSELKISQLQDLIANARIIDFASRKLKIPMDKFMVNIDRYGNTSSASIPMALDEYVKAGKLERGDLILMTAFGGGLAHASCLIKW